MISWLNLYFSLSTAVITRQRGKEVPLPHQVISKKFWNQCIRQEEEAGVDPGWVARKLHWKLYMCFSSIFTYYSISLWTLSCFVMLQPETSVYFIMILWDIQGQRSTFVKNVLYLYFFSPFEYYSKDLYQLFIFLKPLKFSETDWRASLNMSFKLLTLIVGLI